VLATVTTGDTGRFRAYFTPLFIPCAVQAAANGQLSEKTPVMGVPTKCGINGGAPTSNKGSSQSRGSVDLPMKKGGNR